MPLHAPFPLRDWIEAHRDELKPPVGARKVFEDAETIVMIVGGPNARNDFHVDPGEELFMQIEGDMLLRVVDDGAFRDIRICAGDIFLLPANVPHSPRRPPNTVGLVVERKRGQEPHEDDSTRWYCERCTNVIREVRFNMNDGGFLPQLDEALRAWAAEPSWRLCPHCAHQNPAPGPMTHEALP